MRYCGRNFTQTELDGIRALIAANPGASRAALSRYVCKYVNWYRIDGRLKDMSCRVAMLRMQDSGLIQLPPPRNSNNNGKACCWKIQRTEPNPTPIIIPSSAFSELSLCVVREKQQSLLWNEYIHRYHYLGYAPMPGDQIRYIVYWNDRVAALLSFRAAVWTTAPRDQFIGWNLQQRKKNIHLITNNARFLIPPFIQSPNLASCILGMINKKLVQDWKEYYNYSPVMMETFVETPKFRGTCYKASNWIYLGVTKGVGRLGIISRPMLPIKSIWVYPLVKNFRQFLCS